VSRLYASGRMDRSFQRRLQSQEPGPGVARMEGKIEITLEGQGWKLLRWRRLEVCYF